MTTALQHHTATTKKALKRHTIALAMCVGLGLGLSLEVQAKNPAPPSLRADAPNVYIVKKGDTLWDISGRFLKKPWRWPEIWASNKHVKNPHWIYPGDRLLLCTHDGRPLIGKDEGDGCEGVIRRATGQTAYNLSPQIRVESLNSTIPVIPLEDIRHWLERSTIITPDSISNLPYVLGMTEKRVIAAEGDRIYLRGNGIQVGQRYAIYRLGQPYTLQGNDGKDYVAGVELNQIASGLTTHLDNDIATFELNQTFNAEVRKGDLVLPEYDATLPTLFYPVSANQVRADGQVIRVLGSIGAAAKRSVIAINRGITDGVQVGHVFAIDQRGELTTDPKTKEKVQLPGQRIGHAMVFKTFDRISYAYVTDSSLPIKLGATLSAPLSED
jgi:hypothetical protein